MEIQNIETDKPIPSLPCSKVRFTKNNEWVFIYSFNTPVKLTKTKRKKPLYLKGGLVSMNLSEKNPKNSTNLEVYSLEELKELLEQQRESDMAFRKEFKADHKGCMREYKENIFVLDNKTQELSNAYIVRIKRQRDDSTVFVGRCE